MYSFSEAQGIENPVFEDPPAANPEQRPRLIFMSSRQQSDSGRHLLSEPNTPLSPPGPNDVFFPSLGKFAKAKLYFTTWPNKTNLVCKHYENFLSLYCTHHLYISMENCLQGSSLC